MIAYLDSSVVMRLVLNQPDRLEVWEELDGGVVSALVEVECLRTLDRVRLRADLPPEQLVERIEQVHAILASADVVDVTTAVLARAAQAFSTPLGTLDAIHLASALLYRDQTGVEIAMATHDSALELAARASGLPVVT